MKRLIPAAFAGAIVVSLLILLMIELIEVKEPTSSTFDGIQATQDGDPPSNVFLDDPRRDLDCDKAASSLSSRIEASRSCEVDSDCALVGFGCPFGCTDAVNETQLESLRTSERAFQKKCHTCVYMCAAPVFEWRAVCVQNQCRAVDRRVSDFEQETIKMLNDDN